MKRKERIKLKKEQRQKEKELKIFEAKLNSYQLNTQ